MAKNGNRAVFWAAFFGTVILVIVVLVATGYIRR